MVLAMYLFMIDGQTASSDPTASRRILSWLGPIVIFMAFLVFTAASAYLSARLTPTTALMLSVAIFLVSAATFKLARYLSMSGVYAWPTPLVLPPIVICSFSGGLLLLVGTTRWLRATGKSKPH